MSTSRTDDGLLWVVFIVLGVLLLLPLLMMAFAMPMMGMMGWQWGDGMTNGIAPAWRIGIMALWLVVLLGFGLVLFRAISGRTSPGAGADPAIEELRVAYARGDLTEEEFEQRRRNLEQRD